MNENQNDRTCKHGYLNCAKGCTRPAPAPTDAELAEAARVWVRAIRAVRAATGARRGLRLFLTEAQLTYEKDLSDAARDAARTLERLVRAQEEGV